MRNDPLGSEGLTRRGDPGSGTGAGGVPHALVIVTSCETGGDALLPLHDTTPSPGVQAARTRSAESRPAPVSLIIWRQNSRSGNRSDARPDRAVLDTMPSRTAG